MREHRRTDRDGEYRDRSRQTLFIDARKLGYMIDRVLRAFTREDLEKITGTFGKRDATVASASRGNLPMNPRIWRTRSRCPTWYCGIAWECRTTRR